MRACVECRFFEFRPEDGGYSEYTPGSPLAMNCLKNNWTHDALDWDQSFRDNMLKAETCADFVDYREEQVPG